MYIEVSYKSIKNVLFNTHSWFYVIYIIEFLCINESFVI